MVVCLCSCVSEKDIINEIKLGNDTLEKLSARLNVAQTCGTCRSDIEHLISKYKIDKQKPAGLEFIHITG
jgi:bacterioferritin-associated ferredoxin